MRGAGWLRRWLKFNAVGALGIVVQTGMLALLMGVFKIAYMAASALAVETAVLHNFVWHELWTWRDSRAPGERTVIRLIRFNLGNGLVSLISNLLTMRVLVGRYHVNPMFANFAGVAAGALANFIITDLFVFRSRQPQRRAGPGLRRIFGSYKARIE